ncbi:MAG: FAD-dependent monooxygenase, partial [Pseudomonadota bacterium]|nr:FAD-dependent monooxygenase [Pseudomonadota bacterium]
MERADVIILGGGLVGLTLAVALDRHGLTSIVVDPVDAENSLTPQYDGRATAVSSSSWRMLDAIGVSERLEGQGCPIKSIRVSDGLASGGLHFEPPEGDDPLGIMVENRILRAAMRDTAMAADNITMLMPARAAEVVRDAAGVRIALEDSRLITAPLLVGAEGRNSPTRDAAHIPVARWNYDHAAIVVTVAHERQHENVA